MKRLKRFKFEFNTSEKFETGDCENCIFHQTYYADEWITECILGYESKDCPLEEVNNEKV